MFVLALGAVTGLAAGLVGSGVAFALVTAARQRNTGFGLALFLVISFGVGYGVAALLTYGLGADSGYAASAPVLPAGIGAAVLTACWAACRRASLAP